MRRRSLATILIGIIVAVGFVAYWIRVHTLAAARKDTVDRDFVATIQKTEDPYEFEISIKKTNKHVDKKIGGFAVVADLALRDSKGRVFPAEDDVNLSYAVEIGETFGIIMPPYMDSLTSKVRLIRRDLPLGDYIIQPRIRILEDGKDRLRGTLYCDGGTVAVPAGNSVKVKVQPPWMVKPLEDANDVIDPDFAATIAPTSMPNVFLIEVKRVNKNSDKAINSHHEVFVDFDLVDEKGRLYKGDFQIRTFAKEVSDDFAPNDASPYPTSRKGKVRLITTSLSTGTYTIKPSVRVVEEGKDRVENPRAEAGSVKVPAANSVKVTIP
ncbi:MAG: hypothetical protein ABFD46_02750 [Armatimonadota bacterium]